MSGYATTKGLMNQNHCYLTYCYSLLHAALFSNLSIAVFKLAAALNTVLGMARNSTSVWRFSQIRITHNFS
jgi:hypothetical protein